MRIFSAEYLVDLFCVVVIFRKYDCLADIAAEVGFEAVFHDDGEDLSYCVGVEDPFI